ERHARECGWQDRQLCADRQPVLRHCRQHAGSRRVDDLRAAVLESIERRSQLQRPRVERRDAMTGRAHATTWHLPVRSAIGRRSMKTLFTTLAGVATLLVSASLASATPLSFQVNVNTAPLIPLVGTSGPFYLDFQLNDGSGTLAGVNTATISSFSFGGGSAT